MRIHPGMIEELAMLLDGVNNVLNIDNPDEIPSREQWDRLRSRMFHSEHLLRDYAWRLAYLPKCLCVVYVTVNKKKNKIAGIAVCSRSRFFSRPGPHRRCL
jgi:hypothetical protein